MSEITVAELERSLRNAAKTIDREISTAIKTTAEGIRETQRSLVPVASGQTRKSIKVSGPNGARWTPTTVEAEIGPTWFVGRLIELGTVNMGPRPFVAPSYEPHRTAHERRIVNAAVGGALKGLA
jgi:HK97 gp10 family phage protein